MLPPTATWKIPAGRDGVIEFRVRRSMLFAVVFSLLFHLLALFLLKSRLLQPDNAPAQATPFTVRLNLPEKPRTAIPPTLTPPKPQAEPRPRPTPRIPRKSPLPKVIATEKPTPNVVEVPPAKPVEPTPRPRPVPPPKPGAPTDMMSYVNAARDRREQDEAYAARLNAEAVARERKPGEEEVRNEIIKRNLKSGTSGIFDIVSMEPRNAQLVFKGWTNDYGNARREMFLVEAGPDEDIRHNVVRKVIELIRRHYSGDFNWESSRLGRMVVLSAREEDSAGLEDFLMAEFFQGYTLR